MPNALIRYQQTGNLHFVTFSCYRRQPHLGHPDAKNLFEHSLETMRLRYDFFAGAPLKQSLSGIDRSLANKECARLLEQFPNSP